MKLRLCVCFLAALAACAPEPSDIKAIIGATVLDSSGNPALKHSVVLVQGPTIRAVGPQATVPIPAGSHKIDGAGKMVAPADGAGIIEPGKPANLVLMSGGRVERTMRNGEWLESK